MTILSHFEAAAKAQAFLQSPATVEMMKESGVASEPEIFFLGQEEKYVD